MACPMRIRMAAGCIQGEEATMKIVLGFDDSPHALAALRWITRQKWPTQPQVTVVAAVRTPITAYAEVYAPPMPYPADLLEEMTPPPEELSMRGEHERRPAGFPTTVKVLPAD